MIYLDYSATTPMADEVLETYNIVNKQFWGNPSSIHEFGGVAQSLLEKAQNQVLTLLKASNHQVIFTSGATESSNLGIRGIANQYKNRGNHIITTNVEHNSVYKTCESLEEKGFKVTYLDVDSNGLVDLEQLEESITKDTILVSIMHVNGEIGTVMPIEKMGKLIKAKNDKTFFHVDMVQALGKTKINIDKMKVDLASFSAHKIYGPKGVGALVYRKNVELYPLTFGGGQQYAVRSGTIDVPGAVSFSKAMRLVVENLKQHYKHVKELSDLLYEKLTNRKDLTLNSNKDYSLPHVINFSLHNIKSETFVHAFSKHDIYLSSKSACSSKTSKPSRILQSIGLNDDLASHSIRISISHLTKKKDIEYLIKIFDNVIEEVMVKK